MKIEEINIYRITLPLKLPFSSAFGSISSRDTLLIEINSQGISGWGEAPALPHSLYNGEDLDGTLQALITSLVPMLLQDRSADFSEHLSSLQNISGWRVARCGLEQALWDCYAKISGLPLWNVQGGARKETEVGAVVPLQHDNEKTIAETGRLIEQGYSQIKVKVRKGEELSVAASLDKAGFAGKYFFDFNGQYSLADINLFKELDQYNLRMFEQPFGSSDLEASAELQSCIRTAVCLDESIQSFEEAVRAIEIGSCRIISVKLARVGGFSEAKKIHDYAHKSGIAVFCGGMLESAVGKAHNMAYASLPNNIYPSEISESFRYYEDEIITPVISFIRPGIISLPEEAGIGYQVIGKKVREKAVKTYKFVS